MDTPRWYLSLRALSATGTVVGVFTAGTAVQLYLRAHAVPAETWRGSEADDQS
jgi:hypothetical protein